MPLTTLQRVLAGACLIILVICADVGFQYVSNQSEKTDVTRRLAALQATVDKINASTAAGDANDPLLTTPAFPQNPPNLDLASLVLTSAAQSGVTTGPLQATSQSSDKVGNNTYRSVTMSVTAAGSLPQILDFFDRMERGGIKTLVFDNIQVDPSTSRWTAQMSVVVYAQPG